MARNSEKHFVRLNRVFLEEQWKKDKERKRPSLNKLTNASDVKKWIPSIQRELDYCLQIGPEAPTVPSYWENVFIRGNPLKDCSTEHKQLSGARKHTYPDNKIKEFEDRVEALRKEHNKFVLKTKQLDPSTIGIPWQPRAYTSKRKRSQEESHEATKQREIKTPLLDVDKPPTETDMGSPAATNHPSSHAGSTSINRLRPLVSYQSSESDSEY